MCVCKSCNGGTKTPSNKNDPTKTETGIAHTLFWGIPVHTCTVYCVVPHYGGGSVREIVRI